MTHAFIGLMVLYRLTAADVVKVNHYREIRPGIQRDVGYPVSEGERTPMVITQASHGAVNGQAFLDGNDSLWVVDAAEGDEPGQWEAITDG